MNENERINRSNLRRTRGLARRIIEEHGLHPSLFASDAVIGTTIYQELIEAVWPTVITLSPRVLGEVACSGKGPRAKRIASQTSDAPHETTIVDVNGTTQFLMEPPWDGLAIVRRVAASTIIALICDELGIDARRYSTGIPRRAASSMN